MNAFLKHVREQPFVVATAAAALVHSTWSLGTLFSGPQPLVTADVLTQFGDWAAQSLLLLFWLLPALLIAFALDVGQVATASELRHGKRNWKRYLTFGVFSIATYYLQFLYISHHLPVLALSDGINEAALPVAQGVRDAAVWLIPALLPLSTLLYTFSASGEVPPAAIGAPPPHITVKKEQPQLPSGTGLVEPSISGRFRAIDPDGLVIGSRFKTAESAQRALDKHHRRQQRLLQANGHRTERLPERED